MEANTEIRIRAFRATDDPETCRKYIQGHRKVLSIYGIENITTNTDDWMHNPSIFVIAVESLDRDKLYGGASIQAADGIHPLAIEEATKNMDSKVLDVVRENARYGTGEVSGLWNSKEVAGLGIGSLFPTRCGLVITEQIGLTSIFSLSSPATVRFNKWLGSRVLTEVGNSGTFYYPKIDLLATACIQEELPTLHNALPREREKILFLRNNLQYTVLEKSPFKNMYVNVHYDLEIPSANKEEFHIEYEKYELKEAE